MLKTRHFLLTCILAGALTRLGAAAEGRVAEALAVIQAVGPEGAGNEAASRAWQDLSRCGAGELTTILDGMKGANALARNWLRAAVDAVAAREIAGGKPFPLAEFVGFVEDRARDPQARWLAYQWIARVDPGRAEQLVPGWLDDPSGPLRRESVARLMREAAARKSAGDLPTAVAGYRKALGAAREAEQVEAIAAALREGGESVNLDEVFGWVTQWKVIGPFDNTGLKGFERIYPPETELQFDADHDGKSGKIRWLDAATVPGQGKLDLNRPLGSLKEVTGYAVAEFQAEKAQSAELRLGCKNAWKIWINGRFLFGRDEYHRGAEIDQYRLPVELKAGRNTILVKVCQDEKVEDWTVEWEFQLRVTDALGTPIRSFQNAAKAN